MGASLRQSSAVCLAGLAVVLGSQAAAAEPPAPAPRFQIRVKSEAAAAAVEKALAGAYARLGDPRCAAVLSDFPDVNGGSLLDNLEWDMGWGQRFGLVHVDYRTLNRTIKDSGWWYRDWIAQTGTRATVSGPEAR